MRSIRVAAALLVAAAATRADAIPAFARKYGMACSACHVAWPIFNQQGQNFRDNGYQFGLGKDDPVQLSPDYFALAFRTTAYYQYTRATNQTASTSTANGATTYPVTTSTGGVPFPPGVDFLSGGVITRNISYLVVVSGFGPDGTASLESMWARLDNLGGTGFLNLRIGKFELDQPASAHRNVTLTTGYAVYGAHPGGSMVAFDLGENQPGIELDGHDATSATRYAVSLTSTGAGLARGGWSDPLLWGHVQRAFQLGNPILSWARVGAFGGIGWWPTAFDYPTAADADAGTNPIPGTGRDYRRYYRAGAELSWYVGYPSTPAFFTVAYMHGDEARGLATIDPGTGQDLSGRSNSFNGGFAELDWVPFTEASYTATPWLLFARYDLVRYRVGSGDFDGGTVGVRRYLILGPRASAAIHVEGHVERGRRTGWVDPGTGVGRNVTLQTILAGIDFDY